MKKPNVAITSKSKSTRDFKKINFDEKHYLKNSKRHVEYYCSIHMRGRLTQICKDEILADIVLTGTDLMIMKIADEDFFRNCQEKFCLKVVEYKYVRIDYF